MNVTMNVTINGKSREIDDATTIAELLAKLDITVPHVAVEVNRNLVPRAKHAETVLASGDQLEVVTLVGGG